MSNRPPHNAGHPRRPGDFHGTMRALQTYVTALTQEPEKLQKRQPEDGEMIALNACEELHSFSFKPISADGPKNQRSFRCKIVLEEPVTEFPHPQFWSADGMP